MQLKMYTIYDSKAGQYLPPFNSINDATALRQFESAIMDRNHDFQTHAEDYSLWGFATFDQAKAEITLDKLVCLGQAHEILAALKQQGVI